MFHYDERSNTNFFTASERKATGAFRNSNYLV